MEERKGGFAVHTADQIDKRHITDIYEVRTRENHLIDGPPAMGHKLERSTQEFRRLGQKERRQMLGSHLDRAVPIASGEAPPLTEIERNGDSQTFTDWLTPDIVLHQVPADGAVMAGEIE